MGKLTKPIFRTFFTFNDYTEHMWIRFVSFLLFFIYGLLIAWSAQAESFQKGDFILRGRTVAVIPDESGTIIPIGGEPHISVAILPEISIGYFLADNVAVEAIPGLIPHRAKAKNTALGDRDAGYIYALAPTVMLQYHREVAEGISPYLGMGVAYVKYFEDDTVDQLQYKDDLAAIAQAGVNVHLDDKWHLNADVKKVWVGSEVKINGGAGSAKIQFDPVIYGLGMGYKF